MDREVNISVISNVFMLESEKIVNKKGNLYALMFTTTFRRLLPLKIEGASAI